MKSIKPLFILIVSILLCSSCSSDDIPESTFPKLYIYNTANIGECKEYLVEENNTYSEINQTAYGAVVKEVAHESISDFPRYFAEIELLDEERIRLVFALYMTDPDIITGVFDTISNYQLNGDYLTVDLLLDFSAFYLEYNESNDQILSRLPVNPVFPGPNAVDPTARKYASIFFKPAEFETFDEQVVDLLSQEDYAVGDTIRVIETRRIYSRE